MFDRYVLDTCSIISYYDEEFIGANSSNKLTPSTKKIMFDSINEITDNVLVIPNVVFLEIYIKWFVSEEEKERIRFNVFEPLKLSKNIEFKSISYDVLTELVGILNSPFECNFDNHDKQVLASAIELNSKLITSDNKLVSYVNKSKCIPEIIY